MHRPLAALAATLVLVLASTAAFVLAADKPQAWFDQPLPGAVIPFAPTPVTVHATDPGGIKALVFLVDGQPAGEIAAPEGDLVVVTWTWAPSGPGRHLITVRAVPNQGVASDPVSVALTVADPGGAPTPSPTTAPSVAPTATPRATPKATPRPTPTPKPTPTPSPCTPPLPDGLNPVDGATIGGSFNPPTFSWSYRAAPACSPGGFKVTVRDADGAPVVTSPGLSGSARSWTPPAPLPVGRSCVLHTWTLDVLRSNGTVGATVTRVMTICP